MWFFKEICTSLMLVLAIGCLQFVACIAWQFNVGIDHDLSGPTYGLEGKSSSTIKYDSHNGLNLGGTISDLLGPPLKIANGIGSIIKGNNIAGLGTSLKSGGALLGLDAKVLETAGAGNMLKGGMLLGGAKAKAAMAGRVAGPKGAKIASIIEIPVKVVAMKDLAAGKALSAAGAVKGAGAAALGNKGQALYQRGQALKTQGLNQMIQGANEGVQNIGNMVQKTAENVNTALRLLPLVWETRQQDAIQQQEEALAKGQQQQQQQQIIQQQPQQQQVVQQLQPQQQAAHPVSGPYQLSSVNSVGGGGGGGSSALPGGSLLSGLTSFIPGLSSSALQGNTGFGAGSNPVYAALWNTTSPLTNLLMKPGSNPFLLPLTSGPLGQAIAGAQPIGTPEASYDPSKQQQPLGLGDLRSQSYEFNFLPGLKYHETVSAKMPIFSINKQNGKISQSKTSEPVQQYVQVQEPVKQQQQQEAIKKV